jgi:PTH2 family peptidyl-tRNA hydrolase
MARKKTERKVKQVIVMRTDTDPPMRKGKMVAQGSHASIAFLTRRIEQVRDGKSFNEFNDYGDFSITKGLDLTAAMIEWMFNGSFAKICCRCDSLQDLMDIHQKAKQSGLEVHMVTDSGKTEFKEPTVTCLAIGPDYEENIDPITGHLKLL